MRRDQSHAPAFTLHFSPFDLHVPPTNTLDFQGFHDLPRSHAAAPASPRCKLRNLPVKPATLCLLASSQFRSCNAVRVNNTVRQKKMGYYTRVLTTEEKCAPLSDLQQALRKAGFEALLDIDDGDSANWLQLTLNHPDGTAIAMIERNPVGPDSIGAEEIEEFEAELEDARPKSSADWLRTFFPRVRCIYAFQHLSGTRAKNGFDILSAVQNSIWARSTAIIQADGEGFTNENAYHILWQFSDRVTGTWWMGLLRDSRWVHFQMDLGDQSHREAFWRGEIPKGAKMA